MSDCPTAAFELQPAEVTSVVELGAYSLISCSNPAGVAPAAGQFYMLSSAESWGADDLEPGRPFLPRAFSVMRSSSSQLEFLLEAIGPGTRRLCRLESGDQLNLLGPLGQGFRLPEEGQTAILVAGGVGIAPLVPLLDLLPAETVSLVGFRDYPHAQAAELLPGAQIATDDGSVGREGRVDRLLLEALESIDQPHIYACGPPAMLESVRAICAEKQVPAQLALEAPMGCGFGACYGCVVPSKDGYLRVCVDGPVLDASRFDSVVIAGGH